MAKIDRTVFTTNDQDNGDIADPNKLEANDSHIADVVDTNDTNFNSHKSATTLDHPDGSVTSVKIADNAVVREKLATGSVGKDELDPNLWEQTAYEAKFNEIDLQLSNITNALGVIADEYSSLQEAIDDISTQGGGYVLISDKEYEVPSTGLILPSNVIVKGQGRLVSTIKLPSDFSGDAVVKTKNFDTLSGTNKWLTSDGVQHNFGLVDLNIKGDVTDISTYTAPVTLVSGLKIYGKNYYIDRVLIRNTSGKGFYSECGAVGGQNDATDMPERNIGELAIRDTSPNETQFHFRGPHDAVIGKLSLRCGAFPDKTGSEALRFEYSSNVYSGLAHIDGTVHAYGHEVGAILNYKFYAQNLVLESMKKKAVEIGGDNVTINQLELYKNGSSSFSGQNIIDVKDFAKGAQINNIKIKGNLYGGETGAIGNTLVYLGGVGHSIELSTFFVDDTTSIGLVVNCSQSIIKGIIKDTDTGVVFKTGNAHNHINLSLREVSSKFVKTEWDGSEKGNNINLNGYTSASVDTFFNSSMTGVDNANNDFKVFLESATDSRRFPEHIYASGVIDLTTTLLQKINISHNLPFIPVKTSIIPSVNVSNDANRAGHIYELPLRVRDVNDTNVVIDAKLSQTNTNGFTTENMNVVIN